MAGNLKRMARGAGGDSGSRRWMTGRQTETVDGASQKALSLLDCPAGIRR